MDQTDKILQLQTKEQELIERLLGTNDCGLDGIGTMIVGTTFYVGDPHTFSNDSKQE